jgi:hypothetical protein
MRGDEACPEGCTAVAVPECLPTTGAAMRRSVSGEKVAVPALVLAHHRFELVAQNWVSEPVVHRSTW